MMLRAPTLMLLLALPAASSLADNAERLGNNPFSRPSSERIVESTPRGRDEPRSFELRATLVNGNSGFANVSGRILRAGDEAFGYTLVKVYENRAIFIRDGQPLTLYVKPDLVNENE